MHLFANMFESKNISCKDECARAQSLSTEVYIAIYQDAGRMHYVYIQLLWSSSLSPNLDVADDI